MNLTILRKLLFIGVVLLSCLTNLNRADYNTALFTFGYMLWDQKQGGHRVRLAYLIIFSWLVDLAWLVHWGAFWRQSQFDDHWAASINTFAIVLNSLNFSLKAIAIVVVMVQEQTIRYALLPGGLYENAKNLVSPSQ